jgi:hypothetical protein
MKTLATLKAAIIKCGQPDIEIDETRPHECCNQGIITITIDQSLRLQFRASNGTSCCAPYYFDDPNGRSEAIAQLIEDLQYGFEPMSEDTAYACGVDL